MTTGVVQSRVSLDGGRGASTATNTPGTPITVGYEARTIAITRNGKDAYVVNFLGGTLSEIDTATNSVSAAIDVGGCPWAIATAP
ncbi:MAG TPA: hypothetical protein VHY31_01550 [Streptosporangiaceae bacterium]|nr:hypothetical protein [Streptosporangiaceae bacterium]